MNPIVKEVLYTLIRYALVWAFGALLSHHVITEDQKQRFVGFFTDESVLAYLAGAVVTVAIALRVVINARLKLLTALSLPSATTEHVVEQIAKNDPPSLGTPKNLIPLITSKE
jgi:uncharacterized membrane protein